MRSYLYLSVEGFVVPDTQPAGPEAADALVVDLDGVGGAGGAGGAGGSGGAVECFGRPATARALARKAVAAWLPTVPAAASTWVRISPGPAGHDDVREVAGPGLRGVCVARTESITQLDALDAVLSTVELELGLPARGIAVAPVLESAGAVICAPAIARAARVVELHLGEGPLRAELGVDPSADDRELLWARSQVVLASAAAGIGPPICSPPDDPNDLAALQRSTEALRRLGFRGRVCTTPEQVCVVNRVVSPR